MRNFLILSLTLILFTACSSDEPTVDQNVSIYDQTYERLTPSLSFGETDEVFFQRIGDFFRADDGRFFLLDSGQKSIFVFNESGNFETSFGREGRGPMEFEQPLNFFMGNNGLLYTYDFTPFALKVFRESTNNQWGFETSFAVAEQQTVGMGTFPIRVIQIGTNSFATIHRQGFSMDQDEKPVPFDISILNEKGEIQYKHTLELPSERRLIVQSDNSIMVQPQPLGYSQLSNTTPTGMHYFAHNKSSEIFSIDLTDSTAIPQVWATPDLPSMPYTQEEISRALENFEGDMLSQAREGIPDTRPLFNHFVVCDNNLLWLRHESFNSETNETRYIVYNPQTESFERFVSFEGRVRLQHIRGGELVAQYLDEDDMFEIHIYEL